MSFFGYENPEKKLGWGFYPQTYLKTWSNSRADLYKFFYILHSKKKQFSTKVKSKEAEIKFMELNIHSRDR